MEEKFVPGRLVSSVAGRDAGKFYLVFNKLSPNFVQVVNGRERKLSSPKKKNIKHLKIYPEIAKEIVDKKNAGRKISDLDLKKALEKLLFEIQGVHNKHFV
jgi:ribosomal protein L14E/L6E/L27E